MGKPPSNQEDVIVDHIEEDISKDINIINIINIITDRKITTFCISKQIVTEFREHCRLLGRAVNECTEKALLNWVKQNPCKHKTVIVQRRINDKLPDVQERIQLKIFKQDIEDCLEILDRVKDTNDYAYKEWQGTLIKHLRNAPKLNNGHRDIVKLLEQAEKHLE